MQWRLSLLGYWLGTPNGYFGDSTEQAVYAFKKAAGLTRDAIVGRAMQKALVGGVRPHHRSTTGLVIEVNLQRDLVIIVRNGKDQFILNTSTGGGYSYTSQGVTSVATTPTGHFRILREVNGLDVSPLGQLWRPKYFSGGFAIHGDSYVPAVPVSHGCVRVSDEAIDFIWNRNLAPIGTPVWIY
jgi:peptidoglycan hydrolase-like protein with peptidoglycan-binding domain